MKNWSFKVQDSPQGIIGKLESALKPSGGFSFEVDADSVLFNIRKRIKYPDQILHRNRVVVKGKVLNTNAENESDVEISFSQHFFMIMTVLSVIVFGVSLIVIISRTFSGVTMYVLMGLVAALGGVLWIALQKKFERDIQKYKTLISEILEP